MTCVVQRACAVELKGGAATAVRGRPRRSTTTCRRHRSERRLTGRPRPRDSVPGSVVSSRLTPTCEEDIELPVRSDDELAHVDQARHDRRLYLPVGFYGLEGGRSWSQTSRNGPQLPAEAGRPRPRRRGSTAVRSQRAAAVVFASSALGASASSPSDPAGRSRPLLGARVEGSQEVAAARRRRRRRRRHWRRRRPAPDGQVDPAPFSSFRPRFGRCETTRFFWRARRPDVPDVPTRQCALRIRAFATTECLPDDGGNTARCLTVRAPRRQAKLPQPTRRRLHTSEGQQTKNTSLLHRHHHRWRQSFLHFGVLPVSLRASRPLGCPLLDDSTVIARCKEPALPSPPPP